MNYVKMQIAGDLRLMFCYVIVYFLCSNSVGRFTCVGTPNGDVVLIN